MHEIELAWRADMKRLGAAVIVPLVLVTFVVAFAGGPPPDRGHHATRSWQGLLDAGDATASRSSAIPTARSLYLDAFFRARAEHSVIGMVSSAERFAALGDRDVAAQCLAAARRVTTDDSTALARLAEATNRLAAAR
jgi:hypothetical protein